MSLTEQKRENTQIIDIDSIVDGVIQSGRAVEAASEKLRNLVGGTGPITPDMLDRLEAAMMALPEYEIPTSHAFTENSYIREALIPAGLLVIGHSHKDHHFCVALRGRMTVLNPDRTTTEVIAPCTFIAAPGRKLVLVTEDILFQNVHDTKGWPKEITRDTSEENIERVEELLYRRTDTWKKWRASKQLNKAEKTKALNE